VNQIAGKDPLQAVAGMISEYWMNYLQSLAVRIGGALFASSYAALVKDDSGAPISETNFLAAKQLIGDNMDAVTESVMHSAVYSKAVQLKLIADKTGSDTWVSGGVPQMLGTNVSMTDALTPVNSVYNTYIGAPGTILYQLRPITPSAVNDANIYDANGIQVEIARNSLKGGGQDYLISRIDGLIHFRGAAWNTGGGTTSNPTDDQLATDTNWLKAATDNKYIRLAQLKTGV